MSPHPDPILHLPTSQCLIRPYSPSDVPSLARAANNPNIAKWLRNAFPHPYTPADAESWISLATSQSPIRDFAITSPDGATVIGAIGFKTKGDVYYRTVEVGYWVGEEWWGRGIASEAVRGIVEWVWGEWKEVGRVEAEVFEGNGGSERVLGKAGFEFEGWRRRAVEKGGRVLDVGVWCCFRP